MQPAEEPHFNGENRVEAPGMESVLLTEQGWYFRLIHLRVTGMQTTWWHGGLALLCSKRHGNDSMR